MSFLSTRVTKSNKSDWWKLKRVLRWLWTTINEKRIIGIDECGKVMTYIDSSHAVHENMRSHTGGLITMGYGTVCSKSSKQRINTKSSTESEVVATSEYLPYNIWMTEFLRCQGYQILQNVLYQDNQSAMKMERNGRKSCTSNSRHVLIRYFFVKDRIDKEEISLEYCSTEKMLADYFTKPLQGKMFRVFWKVIMGHESIKWLNKTVSSIKEHVGTKEKETKQKIAR